MVHEVSREHDDLLAHVLGTSRTWVVAHPDATLTHAQQRHYNALCERLRDGEPLAYLLGEQWFYGRPFAMTRDTLIPRPETELLMDIALDAAARVARTDTETFIADIGTGSGCIAVTMAAELPRARVVALDSSPAALAVAARNAERHGVVDRVRCCMGDLLEPLNDLPADAIIVANLPYLTTAEWEALPHSIKDFEPRSALDGGEDGLNPYRALFTQLSAYAAQTPQVILEIDPRRKHALAQLCTALLPTFHATFCKDLAGRWRVLHLTLNNIGPSLWAGGIYFRDL